MKRVLTLLVMTVFSLASSPALACNSCFGDPNDPQTKGMAAAIIVMLVVTYLMLSLIFGFFIYRYYKRRGELAALNTL